MKHSLQQDGSNNELFAIAVTLNKACGINELFSFKYP